jgi:hypothetical protein
MTEIENKILSLEESSNLSRATICARSVVNEKIIKALWE